MNDNLEVEYLQVTEEDDDQMLELKSKINGLTQPERIVFLLYAEEGTYTAVAKALKCSNPTVKKYIDKIRQKLCSTN